MQSKAYKALQYLTFRRHYAAARAQRDIPQSNRLGRVFGEKLADMERRMRWYIELFIINLLSPKRNKLLSRQRILRIMKRYYLLSKIIGKYIAPPHVEIASPARQYLFRYQPSTVMRANMALTSSKFISMWTRTAAIYKWNVGRYFIRAGYSEEGRVRLCSQRREYIKAGNTATASPADCGDAAVSSANQIPPTASTKCQVARREKREYKIWNDFAFHLLLIYARYLYSVWINI